MQEEDYHIDCWTPASNGKKTPKPSHKKHTHSHTMNRLPWARKPAIATNHTQLAKQENAKKEPETEQQILGPPETRKKIRQR
eukprot:694654-Amphidinium_carterae.1